MTTSTGASFPLATDTVLHGDAGGTTAPGVGIGDDAGASGDSYANSVSLSTGGIIAIVVVVVVVSILGGTYLLTGSSRGIERLLTSPQRRQQHSSSSQRSGSGPSKKPSEDQRARLSQFSRPGELSSRTRSRISEAHLAADVLGSLMMSRQPQD
jgi:hypothetical protein